MMEGNVSRRAAARRLGTYLSHKTRLEEGKQGWKIFFWTESPPRLEQISSFELAYFFQAGTNENSKDLRLQEKCSGWTRVDCCNRGLEGEVQHGEHKQVVKSLLIHQQVSLFSQFSQCQLFSQHFMWNSIWSIHQIFRCSLNCWENGIRFKNVSESLSSK